MSVDVVFADKMVAFVASHSRELAESLKTGHPLSGDGIVPLKCNNVENGRVKTE
jgi:hypothetical protein